MNKEELINSGLDAAEVLISYLGKDAIGSEFLSEYLNSRELQEKAANDQKESLKKLAASSEQMERETKEISSRAQTNSERLDDIFHEISALRQSVGKIENEYKQYVEHFKVLIQHTTDITKLVDEIANISEQTNLLSFNASIEAAHAGAAGAGFRIIANEVKKLSDSTKQTSEKIMYNVGLLKDSINELEGGTKANASSLSGLASETLATMDKFENVRKLNNENNRNVERISSSISGNMGEINTIIQNVQAAEDLNKKTVTLFADCASKNQMLFNDLYSFVYQCKALFEDLSKTE